MLRTTSTLLATIALLAAASAPSSANTSPREDRLWGEIQAERERQNLSISHGRTDGSLTFLERYSLRREQARIDKLEREALADGRLGPDEYRRIRRAQHDAAGHIRAERRDTQVRGWWWRLWQ